MNYLLPKRLDLLAREYALGTLAGRARRRFERLLQTSPMATLAVQRWQQRLAVLEGATVPLQPPVTNWTSIERRLFPAARETRRGWLAALLTAPMLGGALAGALACVVFLRLQPGAADLEPRSDTLPASYVGLLEDRAGHAALVASSRRRGKVLTLKLLRPLAVPKGYVAELWAVPADGAPFPVSMLPAQGSTRVTLPDTAEELFAKVQDLGVSIEPEQVHAGSAPSSSFILAGHCVKVW